MATFRFRRTDGGSALRGGDRLRDADVAIFASVGAVGIVCAVNGQTAFRPVAREAPSGHGAGPVYQLRNAAVPIAIRQYGDPVKFRYRGRLGMLANIDGEYRMHRERAVYQPEPAPVVVAVRMAARTRHYRTEDDELLLLAA